MPPRNHTAKLPRRSAFTLLETAVAVSIMAVVFIGTMTLFTASTASAAKAVSASTSSRDAAGLMQRLSDQFKEGYLYGLPGPDITTEPSSKNWPTVQGGWPAPLNKSGYAYQDAQGNWHYTGVYVEYPPSSDMVQVYYSAGSQTSVTAPSPFDRSKAWASGTTPAALIYYRADPDGTPRALPDPSITKSATCLYVMDAQGDRTEIASDIATEVHGAATSWPPAEAAVSFSNVGNAVRVKLVCGNFSHLIGQQSSEQTDGSVIAPGFGGRDVLMRNAAPPNLLSGDKTGFYSPVPPSSAVPFSPTPSPSDAPSATASLPPTPTPTPTPKPSSSPTPKPSTTPTPTPTPTIGMI